MACSDSQPLSLRLTAVLVTAVSMGCSTTSVADRVIPTNAGALPELLSLPASTSSSYDLTGTVASHDATVLVWYGTTCPCVVRYQSRVEDLLTRYSARNVAVVGISSNSDDSAAKLEAHLAKHAVKYPVVVDPRGRLARLLQAETTPTVVLLDRQGRVRYRGWIDNERRLGQSGRKPWLENALKAVLGNTEVARVKTSPRGCAITRSLSSACGRCSVPSRKVP